jgi:HK97 family phage portal protein
MSVLRSLLAPFTQRAAPTPLPSSTLFDMIGGRSAAGVTVTPIDSLSVSTVQACVALISRSLASVPLVLYRRTADGGQQPAEDHPLYTILHDLSNPIQTAFEVRQLLFISVLLYGNGYAEIEWGADGYPRALWPLSPEQVTLYRSNEAIVYQVQGDTFGMSGATRWVPAWRMHHLRGLTTAGGLLGISPLRAANAIGLAMATEEFGARFFAQGARPGYILSHPGQLSDKAYQRLQSSWNEGGGANAHKTKIVEEGMKVEKTGVAPDEAQFLQTRAFQVEEICRIFNVSPGLVGAVQTQTYASAEQDLIRFRELTLGPWARNHRAALQRDLLTEAERSDYFIQYKLSALQATDLLTRYRAHQIALMTGFSTQNEVRKLEDLNPVEGGDTLWRPLNMGVTGEPPPDEGDKSETVSLLRSWVEDVRTRLTARIANDVRQSGAKALRNGGRAALQEWGERQMYDWRMAGEDMLAKVPGADMNEVGDWVAAAYQAAVKELTNG